MLGMRFTNTRNHPKVKPGFLIPEDPNTVLHTEYMLAGTTLQMRDVSGQWPQHGHWPPSVTIPIAFQDSTVGNLPTCMNTFKISATAPAFQRTPPSGPPYSGLTTTDFNISAVITVVSEATSGMYVFSKRNSGTGGFALVHDFNAVQRIGLASPGTGALNTNVVWGSGYPLGQPFAISCGRLGTTGYVKIGFAPIVTGTVAVVAESTFVANVGSSQGLGDSNTTIHEVVVSGCAAGASAAEINTTLNRKHAIVYDCMGLSYSPSGVPGLE